MYHPAVQSAVIMVLHSLNAKTAPCSFWRWLGGIKKGGDFFVSLNVYMVAIHFTKYAFNQMIGSQPSCYVQTFPTSKFTQFTSKCSFWYEDSLLSNWVICCQGLGNKGSRKDSQKLILLTLLLLITGTYVLADLTCTLLVSISVSDHLFQPFSSKLRQIIVMQLVYGWHKIW